ncbi:hypothetical protein R1flu_014083 [Riccia fluitans]|uniref:Uncharacterized protein n=1 Tax=Riccia fluitans TaxID=41844 RepID=A0ABD1YI83_9MARC
MSSEQEEHASVATYKPPPVIISQPSSDAFVEVWSPDGSVRRFAAGTKAGFAVERINCKIGDSKMKVVMIEAIKAGEQTVEFGPDAELVSYGKGWRLRAVSDQSNCKNGLKKRIQESRFPPIDRQRLVILHRKNTINWDSTDLSSNWNYSTNPNCRPSEKQKREEVFVGASLAERNSILRRIYASQNSSTNSRNSFEDPKPQM